MAVTHPQLRNLAEWWPQIRPRRIILVGPCGSGKTTLARLLAQRLGCPAIDLDDLFWLPGWQGRDEADFRQRISEAISPAAWTLAGNYSRTQPQTWPRADLVIWIDISMALSLRRVFWRCLSRSFRREIVCNGNRESLRQTLFSRESLLRWVIKTHARQRKRYLELLQAAADPPILRLTHPRQVDTLLEQIWLSERVATESPI